MTFSFKVCIILLTIIWPIECHQNSTLNFEDQVISITADTFSPHQNLEYLSFSHCTITKIENGGLCFASPEKLSFEESYFPPLTKNSFGVCPSLKELGFDHNSGTIDDGAFSGLINLRSLYFVEQHGTTLNKGTLRNLTALESLSITCGGTTTIEPGAFDDLKNLRELRFHENYFPRFDGVLTKNLKNLKVIMMGLNYFKNFPWRDLGELSNLEELSLENNEIKNNFDGLQITKLSKLKKLWISNELQDFPWADLQGLLNLEELDLGGNRIKSAFGGLLTTKLPKLKKLSLGSNELEEFPWHDLRYLPNLEQLSVDYNKIKSIDVEKIALYLPKLKYLDVLGNPLLSNTNSSEWKMLKNVKIRKSIYDPVLYS